jgi:hypothetical protein
MRLRLRIIELFERFHTRQIVFDPPLDRVPFPFYAEI